MPRERVAALHDARRVEHARECTLGCVALEEVNSLGKREFVARLGGVFEHSPWIAERAWHKRPFRSLEELHRAMLDAVVSEEEKLQLARAHPELAGSEALTVDSTSEQARLGFNRLRKNELEEMNRLNRSYREKFGFPCIVALRLHADRASVMAEMERRLRNSRETELGAALEQIGHITRGRLEKLLNG
jgi:OHCU decarboxylase